MSDSIERVLFNPRNGRLAVGVRLRFMDKYQSESLGAFDGEFELKLEPKEPDAWAIDNEFGVWVVVADALLGDVDDLGPL